MNEDLINALAHEFDGRYHEVWSICELHAIEAAFRYLGRGADGSAAIAMGETAHTLLLWERSVDRFMQIATGKARP